MSRSSGAGSDIGPEAHSLAVGSIPAAVGGTGRPDSHPGAAAGRSSCPVAAGSRAAGERRRVLAGMKLAALAEEARRPGDDRLCRPW